MDTKIYNQTGKEDGTFSLPENVFGLPWNGDLVHQVVVSMQANARGPVAHVKDRSAVRGGGKKPWKQKGTGRARHGSSRSPIWIGGGVTHGPLNERDFSKKINKKMRAKALFTVLSEKFRKGEIIFVSSLDVKDGKATNAKEILSTLAKVKGFEGLSRRKNAALLSLGERKLATHRAFGNFGNILVKETKDINPVDLMNYRYAVIVNPETSIKALSSRV